MTEAEYRELNEMATQLRKGSEELSEALTRVWKKYRANPPARKVAPMQREPVNQGTKTERAQVESPKHIVQPGDTMIGIAAQHGLSVQDILRYNPQITNPDHLWIGQEVLLRNTLRILTASKTELLALPGYGSPVNPLAETAVPDDWVVSIRHGQPYSSPPAPPKFIGQYHPGIDLNRYNNVDDGLPVYAVQDGSVLHSDIGPGTWGGLVVIRHNEICSRYAHLKVRYVEKGGRVRRGDKIGLIGGSQWGLDPHLHFELVRQELLTETAMTRWSGKHIEEIEEFYLDPVNFINAKGWWRNV